MRWRLQDWRSLYFFFFFWWGVKLVGFKGTKDIITFKKIFYLFLERGEGREKERRETSVWLPLSCPLLGTWPITQACALTGN